MDHDREEGDAGTIERSARRILQLHNLNETYQRANPQRDEGYPQRDGQYNRRENLPHLACKIRGYLRKGFGETTSCRNPG